MWLPVTENTWPLTVIVPALTGVASPQFIVAVKLAGVAAALISVKVATVPVKGEPATAWKLTGDAVIGDATVAVSVTVAVPVPGATSEILTVTVNDPAIA